MTMPPARLRVLLVDDEPLALIELRRLLSQSADVLEVVGEARDAETARRLIDSLEPDLLFLDITLPDEDGLSLLASIDAPPRTVFVTAYDEHAIRAFELNALDYLLKPVDPRRLAMTLARVVHASAEHDEPEKRAGAHEATMHAQLAMADRIFLREGERAWFVTVAELRLLEVHREGTRLHFGRGSATVSRPLRTIEERLATRHFVRANRTQIVGIAWVRDVTPWFAGRLKLQLDDGQEVLVSRRQAREVAARMSL